MAEENERIPPSDVATLRREVRDLSERLRRAEELDSPALRRLVKEFDDLRGDLHEIEINGSASAREASLRLENHISKMEAVLERFDETKAAASVVAELMDEREANRRAARAAVLAALVAIGTAVVGLIFRLGNLR